MVKDLTNVKTLAGLLEAEAASLRQLKPSEKESPSDENGGTKSDSHHTDSAEIASGSLDEDEDIEFEPKENGSDAVERRIEKVMSDLRDQNVVDIHNEKVYEAKKVSTMHLVTADHH
jgi:hypothetical protein